MNKPLVSVVMATFNEPVEYITVSIKSILEQTYSNLELIIADDSTNIDTIKAIDAFVADERVKVIRHSVRMGFVKALNEGLRTAKGEYIARMDGDDVSEKGRLKIQLDYLASHPSVDVLGGAMNIIDKYGSVISQRYYPTNSISLLFWSVLRNPLGHPTVMFRRKVVELNFFYDEFFTKAEDLELWLRLRKYSFKIKNTSQILLNFRVIGDLASKRTGDNFDYNYKARLKNLSVSYFLFDILSITIVKIYCLMPKKIISIFYTIENK